MLVLVRYGEIGLKSSQVKKRFEERLRGNLEDKLSYLGIEGEILESEGRIFARVPEEDAADAVLGLSRVPGVVSVSPVVKTSLEPGEMCDKAVELLEDVEEDTFAVDARRAGEHDFTSKDLEEEIGQRVVDELGFEVDLEDPGVTLGVEARYTNAYLYTETVEGVGGLPVSDENRVAVLMEDRASTVAAFLLMKRGCKLFPVYAGKDPSGAEREMDILRRFDPEVKLTVLEGDTEEALEEACELYDCGAAAVPLTSGELEQELPEVGVELLLPNAGMSEEEVLDRYSEIMPAPGNPV